MLRVTGLLSGNQAIPGVKVNFIEGAKLEVTFKPNYLVVVKRLGVISVTTAETPEIILPATAPAGPPIIGNVV